MKLRLLLVLSIGLLFAGCGAMPTDMKRTEGFADKKITDISSAPKIMKPVGALVPGKPVKITLDEKLSPVFAQGEVNSRFELLEVAGKKDQPYAIDVVARCSCFGFSKRAVHPVGYLLNESGAVVAQETPNARTEGDAFYKMVTSLRGSFPADGTYFVAVVADYHGERKVRVGDAIGYAAGSEFRLPIYQYPTGDVVVSWLAEQKKAN